MAYMTRLEDLKRQLLIAEVELDGTKEYTVKSRTPYDIRGGDVYGGDEYQYTVGSTQKKNYKEKSIN